MKSRKTFATVLMTGLLLGAVVAMSAPSLRDYFTWSPKVFGVDSKLIAEVIDQMRREGDTVLKDIEADEPDFAKTFAARTSKFVAIAMNSVVRPDNVVETALRDQARSKSPNLNSDWTSGLSYTIGKTAKNLIIFTIENALTTLSKPSKPMPYKYKFCEQNPKIVDGACGNTGIEPEYNYLSDDSREYIFARRLVSHPLFVERMCPAAMSFATWYFNWGWAPGFDTPVQKMAVLKIFFDQLDIELEALKNPRKAPRPIAGALPLDPQISDFLMRRSLDGGVPWLEAVGKCSRQIQQEFLNQSTATSSTAAAKIAEILRLRIAGRSDSSAVLPAIESTQQYRLARTLDVVAPLPENIYFDSKGSATDGLRQNYVASGYLDTVSGLEGDALQEMLLNHLGVIDAGNRYRLMTETDFRDMTKQNPALFDVDENFCVLKEPLADLKNHSAIRFAVHTMGRLQTVNPGDDEICFPYENGETKSILYFVRRPR